MMIVYIYCRQYKFSILYNKPGIYQPIGNVQVDIWQWSVGRVGRND